MGMMKDDDAKRAERKRLKRAFHRQHQRQVLERRLHHSLERGDLTLAEQTKLDLEKFGPPINAWEQQEVELSKQEATFTKELRRKHFDFILKIYQKLELAEYSNDEARTLLHHMSKATAAETSQYENNRSALQGYAKQKFISRARLISDSIAKVCFLASIQYSEVASKMETSLSNAKAIVSVGCGPGCDLAGAMAGLEDNALQFAIALDNSMDEWAFLVRAVLSSATTMLHDMRTCDIRQDPGMNVATKEILDQIAARAPSVLITVSYVLCETRGEWYEWMDQLVSACGVGTLWLLTEPTAWQLHIFRKRYSEQLDFLWLDTCLYREDLQECENRNGPAVLLCQKRSSIVGANDVS